MCGRACDTYRVAMHQSRGVPRAVGALLPLLLVLPVTGAATAATPDPHTAPAAHAGPSRGLVLHLHDDTARSPGKGWTRGVRSWPGTRIPYWADLPTSYQWSLKAAVATWNSTGMRMTFVRTSKAKAKLRITIGDTHGADGYATIGYQPSNWVRLRRGLVTPVVGESAPYARVVGAHIIAHELGHVLGLQHTSGCELMTPILELPTCSIMAGRLGFYRRITDRAAVRKTVARYGGRVTLGPSARPLDPLPPRLGGIAFSGGYGAAAPVHLSWTPPAHAPAGSRVQLLVTSGPTCRYPIGKDYWGTAVYVPSSFAVLDELSPARGSVTPRALGVSRHCYALALVNRSGAGSAPRGKVMQSWVPAPPKPTVTSVLRRFDVQSSPGQYDVTLDYDTSQNEFVVFLARPAGQCATSWPAGERYQDHEFLGAPGEPTVVYAADSSFQPIADACLTFFTVRSDGSRHSAPVVHQVGTEPAPEVPVIDSVVKTSPDLYTVAATYDDVVAGLAVVVSPKDACVSSWPQGQDPMLSLVGTYLDTTGYSLPCLTFFTVNATGGTSDPVAVQTVAATPPTPDITSVTINAQGGVFGFTPLVPYGAFGMAVTIGPPESCQPFPTGTTPWDLGISLYDDGNGHGEFSFHSDEPHPCLTFYTFNWDGDLSAATTRQL